MSNPPILPVLAVDVPYKKASHTKPTRVDISWVIDMLATVRGITVAGGRNDPESYE